jgi:type IV pilus assembly protein PilM
LSLEDLAEEDLSESPKSEVLLFATSKQLSQELADIFASAGLKALSAEIRGLALQRLLSYLHPYWLRETEMIIDASEHSVDIHIFKENLIVFSRRKSINLHEYNPEVENNVEEVFILEDELSDHLEGQRQVAATKTETRTSIEDSYLNEVFLEIERAQNFFRYSLNERETEITRTIVTGEYANRVIDPLQERMESVKVVRIDFHSILAPDFMDNDLLDSCSTAIGLAMRANEKIKKNNK